MLLHPPTWSKRRAILRDILGDHTCDESVELDSVVAATEGYSAADIKALCREAVCAALLRRSAQVFGFPPQFLCAAHACQAGHSVVGATCYMILRVYGNASIFSHIGF